MDNLEIKTLEVPAMRAMTRRQVKEMKLAGFNPMDAERNTLEMFDWILDNVYSDIDLDDYPSGDCLRLAADTFKLAMGQTTDEAKNS